MKKILITAASIALIASSANAKGLDSYYGKAAIGWGYAPNYKIHYTNAREPFAASKGKGMLGTLGFGYSLNNNFRSDLEFYIDSGLKGTKNYQLSTGQTYKVTTKVNTYAGLLNAYYDFKNSSKFTPFVMAGVGYARNKIKISDGTVAVSKSKGGFAYQLGLGISYEASKAAAIELGYRFIDKGVKKVHYSYNGQVTDAYTKKNIGHTHAFLVGVRVGF